MSTTPQLNTLQDAANFYLEHGRWEFAPNTYMRREYAIRRFVEHSPKLPVAELTGYHLTDYIAGWPNWSPSTQRTEMVAVRCCFSWLRRQGLIDRNPFRDVRLPRMGRRRPMTVAELRMLLRTTNLTDDGANFRRVLLFLRMTGCRPGELMALEWCEIDWNESFAIQEHHKTYKKTGKPRIIILPRSMLKMLRWIEANQRPASAFVFLNSRGQPWSRSAIRQRMKRVARIIHLMRNS